MSSTAPLRHKYSLFEEFILIDIESTALGNLLYFCDLISIIRLRRACMVLNHAIEVYCAETWDAKRFLASRFSSVEDLFQVMSATKSIMYGPEVLRFLDRSTTTPTPVDLCVRYEGVATLVKFLKTQNYKFSGIDNTKYALWIEGLAFVSRKFPKEKVRSSGERNSNQTDLDSIALQFVRISTRSRRPYKVSLNVHVVRCDPYRHVLATYGTALMNIITSAGTLSLFPFSTFSLRKSLICRQDHVKSDAMTTGTTARLREYCQKNGIGEIGMSHKVIRGIEIGNRYFGDPLCWYIPNRNDGHNKSLSRPSGISFEVLDWTSNTTRPDSYLRIGEPKIWSTYAMVKERAKVDHRG